MASTPPIHAIPINLRPPPTSISSRLRTLSFNAVFFVSCLIIHLFQLLIALPLYPFSPSLSRHVIAYSKEAFAALLVAITAGFGPSTLIITVGEGVTLKDIVKRGEEGEVIGFELEKHTLWTANHQQYSDWIYLWILMFRSSISAGLCIILKASLEWTPILGPAMQMFQFAFVSKQKPLQSKGGIFAVAKQNLADNRPFSLLLFPEGTLVSPLTRPKSAAFAEATGVKDLRNTLLPRSTGLLYSIRTLKSLLPDLAFYDVTIGYPGVPDQGYAQEYYKLQTIYGLGHSPPQVHLHIRKIDLSTVPFGNLPPLSSPVTNPKILDDELTPEERGKFQDWTREEWVKKDELMNGFYRDGKFPESAEGTVELGIRLSSKERKFLLIPLGVWVAYKGIRWSVGWFF